MDRLFGLIKDWSLRPLCAGKIYKRMDLRHARLSSYVLCVAMLLLMVGCDVAKTSLLPAFCQVNSQWECLVRDTDAIPREMKEICQTCGTFYSSIKGIDLCCRCNEFMFAMCFQAVTGFGR